MLRQGLDPGINRIDDIARQAHAEHQQAQAARRAEADRATQADDYYHRSPPRTRTCRSTSLARHE